MIITLANVKGGSGKTTAAMHLAAALHQEGTPVVAIDADAQGSSIRWAGKARKAQEPLPFSVESLATKQLVWKLDEITAGRTAVIDCGPGDADIITAAIDVADVVVIPANASEDDIDQAAVTIEQCRASDIPSGVLLSRIRTSESLPSMFRSDLTAAGVHVFQTEIHELVRLRAHGAYIEDVAPFDKLLAEIRDLVPAQTGEGI